MTTLALLAVGAVAFLLLCLTRGIWASLFTATVLGVVFAHRFTNNSHAPYTGLAAASPEFWTYSAVVFAGALLLLARGSLPVPRVFFPFAALLGIGLLLWWPISDSHVQAGVLQLMGGLLAWSLGARIGKDLSCRNSTQNLLVNVTLGVVLIELAVCVAQLAGININAMDPSTAALMGSRVNGTMNHPNNLGKVLLLFIVVLTLFSQSEDKALRRKALAAIALATVPLALTGGRAVFLAGLGVVVLSHVMNSAKKNRLMFPISILVLIAPFASAFIARFEEDPDGGSRPYMTQLALDRISQDPFTGVGPNMYVHVVGATDAFTARGLPVHNGFLLVLAEIGLIGLVALFAPFIVLGFAAWRRRRTAGLSGAAARTFCAALPALALVVATGWAMLSGPYLHLWFLIMGILVSQFLPSPPPGRRPTSPAAMTPGSNAPTFPIHTMPRQEVRER